MKRLLFALLIASHAAFAQTPQLAQWTKERPEAAAALDLWIRAHTEAARHVFLWDVDHPQRAELFFTFVADHPEATLDGFMAAHPDWPVVDLVLKPYAEALRRLVALIHAHPLAVHDFASQARGFAWLGFHDFKPLWRAPAMEPRWEQLTPSAETAQPVPLSAP